MGWKGLEETWGKKKQHFWTLRSDQGVQLVTIRCVAKGCSWRWIVSCTSEPNHNTKLQQLLILKLKIHKCTKTHEYSKFSSAQLRRKFNLFACHFGCFDLELRPSLWLRPDSVQTHPRVTLNEKYPRGRFVTRLRLICSFEEKVQFKKIKIRQVKTSSSATLKCLTTKMHSKEKLFHRWYKNVSLQVYGQTLAHLGKCFTTSWGLTAGETGNKGWCQSLYVLYSKIMETNHPEHANGYASYSCVAIIKVNSFLFHCSLKEFLKA